ncbi:hypothetical protein ACGFZP_21430 [Kitasatospora sp. NPDC048239]|uniref:hypothetical protein n=1 Tax=Kitasatospora sp. NPDC048239 TaxID=3364046 RepID=UPI00370F9C41
MDNGDGEPTARRFALHAGYAVYRGPSTDSGPHAHAAFQIGLTPAAVLPLLTQGA